MKAVVLRINSPGGSSLASDIIYREVVLTKKVKPIIASMSDVAASGGYYIAMACDTIVAHPNTITGSIGVFGVLPNIQPLLADKLGITVDRVNTGKFSDLPTITRALTDFEKQHPAGRSQQHLRRLHHQGRPGPPHARGAPAPPGLGPRLERPRSQRTTAWWTCWATIRMP